MKSETGKNEEMKRKARKKKVKMYLLHTRIFQKIIDKFEIFTIFEGSFTDDITTKIRIRLSSERNFSHF